jgi:hypothetical protein
MRTHHIFWVQSKSGSWLLSHHDAAGDFMYQQEVLPEVLKAAEVMSAWGADRPHASYMVLVDSRLPLSFAGIPGVDLHFFHIPESSLHPEYLRLKNFSSTMLSAPAPEPKAVADDLPPFDPPYTIEANTEQLLVSAPRTHKVKVKVKVAPPATPKVFDKPTITVVANSYQGYWKYDITDPRGCRQETLDGDHGTGLAYLADLLERLAKDHGEYAFHIVTDQDYVVRAIQTWAAHWVRTGKTKSGKVPKNFDTWKRIYAFKQTYGLTAESEVPGIPQ